MKNNIVFFSVILVIQSCVLSAQGVVDSVSSATSKITYVCIPESVYRLKMTPRVLTKHPTEEARYTQPSAEDFQGYLHHAFKADQANGAINQANSAIKNKQKCASDDILFRLYVDGHLEYSDHGNKVEGDYKGARILADETSMHHESHLQAVAQAHATPAKK